MQRTRLQSFDDLQYGDKLVYIGPDRLPSPYAAPRDYQQPYQFQHVSFHGTLKCLTRHGSPKYLTRDHPANDPENWRRATPEEVEN